MKAVKLKQVVCFLLMLAMLTSLWACNSEAPPPALDQLPEDDGLDDFDDFEDEGNEDEPDNGENEQPEAIIGITVEELANAQIVIPENSMVESADGYVYSAVLSLQRAIKTHYKVELPIVNDAYQIKKPVEILVGDTNREESSTVLTTLLLNDYGYTVKNSKLVIRGGNDEGLKLALNRMSNSVVASKAAGTGYFYTRELDWKHSETYLAKDATLNGTKLSEYAIVYPAKSLLYEKELAERLANSLQTLTGKKVASYPDNKGYLAGTKEILIGDTNREFTPISQAAAVETDANFVSITGANAYQIGLAQETLMDFIGNEIVAKRMTMTLPATTPADERDTVTMMGYNINGTTAALKPYRIENLCRLITKYLPDFAIFQEPAENMMRYIQMQDYYGYYMGIPRHGEGVPALDPYWPGANSYAPILYAKDRYEVIEGGTKWMTDTPDVISRLPGSDYYRIYTYALFEDKHTGERFVVVNHHLDFDKQVQVTTMKYMFEFLQKTYTNIPIVMAGDFNATASSPVIQDVITADIGGFTSASNIATRVNVAATSGDIDFIFVTDCCVDVSYFTMCRETYPDPTNIDFDHKMPSDHPAVYAELTFNSKRGCTHDWSGVQNYVYNP